MYKNIYLLIENRPRELLGRLLLAIQATTKKFNAVVIEHGAFIRNIDKVPPGIILYKDHGDWAAASMFQKAKNLGFATTALDEEGLIFFDEDYYVKTRVSSKCLDNTDVIFTWGKYQKDIISKTGYTGEKNIVVSGNPRLDPYKAMVNKGSRKDILVNMRFGAVNHKAHNSLEGYLLRLESSGAIRSQKDVEFRARFYFYMKELLDHFVFLIKDVASSFPERKIIVRPHPAEDRGIYHNIAETFDNVHVSQSTIYNDIANSEYVIHNGCTTGLEAMLSGAKVIVFSPISQLQEENNLSNRFGVIATSSFDVKRLIDNKKVYAMNDEANRLEQFIYNASDKVAFKEIITELKYQFGAPPPDSEKNMSLKIRNSAKHGFKNLILNSRGLQKITPTKKVNRWHYNETKFIDMENSEFKHYLGEAKAIYSAISDRQTECSFRKIGPKAFLISQSKN